MELWGFLKLIGSGFPQIFSAPSGETMRQTPNVSEVQKRARGPLSPCQIWWGSDFTRRRSGQKRCFLSVRLFVCLSVTLLNVTVCAPDFTMKALEYRNDFMPLNREGL